MKRGTDSEKQAFKEALRRMLTDDLLRECLYDCNEDTRRYAARLLRRRKARRV